MNCDDEVMRLNFKQLLAVILSWDGSVWGGCGWLTLVCCVNGAVIGVKTATKKKEKKKGMTGTNATEDMSWTHFFFFCAFRLPDLNSF